MLSDLANPSQDAESKSSPRDGQQLKCDRMINDDADNKDSIENNRELGEQIEANKKKNNQIIGAKSNSNEPSTCANDDNSNNNNNNDDHVKLDLGSSKNSVDNGDNVKKKNESDQVKGQCKQADSGCANAEQKPNVVVKPKFKEKRPVPLKLNKTHNIPIEEIPLDLSRKT